MMKKYRCKETFYIDKYDEDGFWMEKQMAVVKGSKWQRVINDKNRICGNRSTLKLERFALKKLQWIEITEETLEGYFELVSQLKFGSSKIVKEALKGASSLRFSSAEGGELDPLWKKGILCIEVVFRWNSFQIECLKA